MRNSLLAVFESAAWFRHYVRKFANRFFPPYEGVVVTRVLAFSGDRFEDMTWTREPETLLAVVDAVEREFGAASWKIEVRYRLRGTKYRKVFRTRESVERWVAGDAVPQYPAGPDLTVLRSFANFPSGPVDVTRRVKKYAGPDRTDLEDLSVADLFPYDDPDDELFRTSSIDVLRVDLARGGLERKIIGKKNLGVHVENDLITVSCPTWSPSAAAGGTAR